MTLSKLVKGATKIKMAPPKQKYVEPILQQSSGSRHSMQEVVQLLGQRIQGSNEWTIVFKALVVLHLMIQDNEMRGTDGYDDDRRRKEDGSVILDYMTRNMDFFNGTRKILSSSKWSRDDVKVIERYNQYLKIRCKEYDLCGGTDYVKVGFNIAMKYRRARSQQNLDSTKPVSIATELDHVESLENTISALIKNRFSQVDLQNDLILYSFKLLVADLLPLYNSLNEGVIALLESFFELNKSEAKRTLELYKSFVDLTDYVVKYLKIGKSVGLKIPVIKHITTKLISSLEDHIRNEEAGVRPSQRTTSGQQQQQQQQHSTTSPDTTLHRSDTTKSMAQQKLEQIREQKKQLEQQLQNQQVLITPTVAQDQFTNNPFSPNDAFSFEATGNNPFALSSTQQQMVSPQQQQMMSPQQQQMVSPQQQQMISPQQQQTGMFAGNTQITPGYTGAGFGGYTQGVIPQQQAPVQQPMRTASNNPFSVENMAQYEQQQMENPFGGMPTIQEVDTNPQLQQQVTYAMIPVQITNPFAQQPQQ